LLRSLPILRFDVVSPFLQRGCEQSRWYRQDSGSARAIRGCWAPGLFNDPIDVLGYFKPRTLNGFVENMRKATLDQLGRVRRPSSFKPGEDGKHAERDFRFDLPQPLHSLAGVCKCERCNHVIRKTADALRHLTRAFGYRLVSRCFCSGVRTVFGSGPWARIPSWHDNTYLPTGRTQRGLER
jgi:hypothetical protein